MIKNLASLLLLFGISYGLAFVKTFMPNQLVIIIVLNVSSVVILLYIAKVLLVAMTSTYMEWLNWRRVWKGSTKPTALKAEPQPSVSMMRSQSVSSIAQPLSVKIVGPKVSPSVNIDIETLTILCYDHFPEIYARIGAKTKGEDILFWLEQENLLKQAVNLVPRRKSKTPVYLYVIRDIGKKQMEMKESQSPSLPLLVIEFVLYTITFLLLVAAIVMPYSLGLLPQILSTFLIVATASLYIFRTALKRFAPAPAP